MKNMFLNYSIVAFAVFSVVLMHFNAPLAMALLVLGLFTGGTGFFLWKAGVQERQIYILLLIVTVVYLGATLFIHYTNFYPFGGGEGDQVAYHKAAAAIAHDFRQGNFSVQNIKENLNENASNHFYPVIIGTVYALTISDKIVGKMVSIWFVALSALLLYAIVLYLGGSKKWAFWIGLFPIFYPSYLYFGSLLLRESLVAFLVLFSSFLMLKLFKRFSFVLFSLFYFILGALIHFRFYPGFVVLFVFAFSWSILSRLHWKKRILYGSCIVFLLGFLPQFFGHGYYGINEISYFVKPSSIVGYRENSDILAQRETEGAATKSKFFKDLNPSQREMEGVATKSKGFFKDLNPFVAVEPSQDLGSTFVVRVGAANPATFVKNYLISFSFMLLGPFPWQIRYARQLFVLLETIPWWVLIFFLAKGLPRSFHQWKNLLPIFLVSMGILAEMALVMNSYGTYMRIRIPAFLLLIALLPFAFQKKEAEKIT